MAGFLSVILLSAILLLRCCPDTMLARSVRSVLVENPCRWWLDLSRRDVLYAIVLVFVLLTCGELMMMLGSTDLVLAYAVDLTIYADTVITTTLIAAATNLRNAWHRVKALVARPLRSGKAKARQWRQPARRSDQQSPANDEDGPAALAA